MAVDLVKRVEQAFPRLPVEGADALAKLADRRFQVFPFSMDGLQPCFDFAGFFLCSQINAAKAFAFTLQPVHPVFNRCQFRQGRFRLQSGYFTQILWRAIKDVPDLSDDLIAAQSC